MNKIRKRETEAKDSQREGRRGGGGTMNFRAGCPSASCDRSTTETSDLETIKFSLDDSNLTSVK